MLTRGANRSLRRRGGHQQQTIAAVIRSWFRTANGYWLDPSDFSTMFQDSAGTTPVTALEQTVGKILDKSGRGNHFIQPTMPARPKLTARVNLLTKSEQLDDAAWAKSGVTIDSIKYAAHDGALKAEKVTFAAGNANASITQTVSASIGAFVQGFWIRADSVTTLRGRVLNNGSSTATPVIPVTTEWQYVPVARTGTGTGITVIGLQNNAAGDAAPVYIAYTSLVPANLAHLPYQRVNTATDYDSVGFPIGLQFDGIDDFLYSAANVDLTGTDKITLFAGVRKLSDAAAAILLEHSSSVNTNPGSFSVTAPEVTGASGDFRFSTRGTGSAASAASPVLLAPISKVLTGIDEISTPVRKLRVDGVEVASSSASQGTGNFGSYVTYIGRRAGTSLPFNGLIYGLICRGAATDAATIQRVERYADQKAKVVM